MPNPEKQAPPLEIVYQDFVLRPPNISDLKAIDQAFKESVQDLKVYMEWAHYPLSYEKQMERVAEQYARYFLGVEYEVALFRKNKGDFLVYLGIYPINRINPRSFEIGFWVPSKHAGNGYATLATKIMVAFLFEYIKADRIEITSNLENKASLRVIEKCGFHYEGELRNFYPKGTPEMFQNRYTKERRVASFSLIPEDTEKLSWYLPLLDEICAYPLFKEPFPLSACQNKTFSENLPRN